MSAFIVEDKTINEVIAYLAHGRNITSEMHVLVSSEAGCDLKTPEGCAALGQAMFELNCAGVDARYDAGESKTFRDDMDYKFRATMPPSIIQAYKSLGCWHYQCSEGDIPTSSLLYATMQRVSDILAHEIVRNLPAYEKARW